MCYKTDFDVRVHFEWQVGFSANAAEIRLAALPRWRIRGKRMAHRLDICKCYVCGNVVEVVHGGEGVLWCCGRPMSTFSEKNVDAETEEYFPIVQRTADGVTVTVGSDKQHDAGEDHHIQWIEVIADHLVYRRFFRPKETPEVSFKIDAEKIRARAYCTQHGLCVERRAK